MSKISAAYVIAAIVGLIIAAQPTHAVNPSAPLQPSSRWRVDYADSECRLFREFGTGADAITLRIVRRDASDLFETIIAGPGIPRLPRKVDVSVGLEPQNFERQFEGYSFEIPKGTGRLINLGDITAELFERFQADQVVRFAAANRFTTRLQLTEARAALAALDACYADLLKGWGVDPATVVGVVKRPRPIGGGSTAVTAMRAGARHTDGPASWVTWTDYPTEALREEASGTVVMALAIGTTGRIDDCRVIVSSKSAALDRRSCELLTQRARYEPAQDASGKAVPATTILRVRWSIPQD